MFSPIDSLKWVSFIGFISVFSSKKWGMLKIMLKRKKKIKHGFVFSKKATKNDAIFTVNLTLTTYCQIEVVKRSVIVIKVKSFKLTFCRHNMSTPPEPSKHHYLNVNL